MISFLISLISFTIAVTVFYTAIMIWWEHKVDAGVLRAYTIEAFCVIFWCIGYTFMYNSYDYKEVQLFYKISCIGWVLLPSANIYFVWKLHLSLTDRKGNYWLSLLFFAPYPYFIYHAMKGHLLATDFHRISWGWVEIIPNNSAVAIIYTFALLASLGACFTLLIVRYRNTSLNKHRMQILLIIVPAAIIGVVGIFINILSPTFNLPHTPAFAHLLWGGWVLFLGYLVMHYQVLSIHPNFVMETILFNMHDMIILTGRFHNVVMANSAAERILEYSSNEMVGIDAAILFDDGNRRFVRAALHAEEIFEVEFISRNGKRISCHCNIKPVKDHFNDQVGYVVFARDIRDMKKLEVITNEVMQQQIQLRTNFELIEKKNERMNMELELARQIQRNLVPLLPPEIPGVSFSMIYQPMTEVGGDLYDFVRFDDQNKIGLFISDVSGHGVPAALVSGMIKTLLMTSSDYRENPEALLSYINQRIIGQISNNFATAFYCVYDVPSKFLQFARAGHPFPLLLRNGKIIKLESKGILLGFNKNIEAEVCSIELIPGDKLLLFTDGLLEAIDSTGAFFEEKMLNTVFLAHAEKSASQFTISVFEELNEFKKNLPFEDDVCILCMEVQ